MNSLGKGTVPESGEGLFLAGSLSVSRVGMINRDSKGRVCLEVGHDGGGEIDLLFRPAQFANLKGMIEEFSKTGISKARADAQAKGRCEFIMGLDVAREGFSVEVLPPDDGAYDDPTFAVLRLKDKRGGEMLIDLSLDVARQIKKKLDAFFAAEREQQEARLE